MRRGSSMAAKKQHAIDATATAPAPSSQPEKIHSKPAQNTASPLDTAPNSSMPWSW
ncbi:hypothetical protein D3C81_834050 [compost metagenome]